jgi:transposase
MIWVGIDWSDQVWDYHAWGPQGKALVVGQVKPGFSGMADLFGKLEVHAPADQIAVAIETKHGPAVQALLDRGYRVYPVNPRASQKFREAMHLAGDKTDPMDAETLARLLATFHEKLHPLKPDAPELVALRIACEDRLRLVKEHTAKLNELQDLLKAYCPAFLGFFADLDSQVALAFLEEFPTQEMMRSLTPTRVRGWLKRRGYPCPQRIDAMVEHLRRPVLPVAAHLQDAKRPRIRYLARALAALGEELRECDDQINHDLDRLPEADWIRSLPGVGLALGPALLACLGRDPNRFAHVGQARALFGTAPVTEQSGARRSAHFRRGCWKFARRTFQLFAQSSLATCGWANEFYHRQRDRGRSHHQALRALAHKWVKILLALQRTGLPYNEAVFRNSQRRYLLKATP